MFDAVSCAIPGGKRAEQGLRELPRFRPAVPHPRSDGRGAPDLRWEDSPLRAGSLVSCFTSTVQPRGGFSVVSLCKFLRKLVRNSIKFAPMKASAGTLVMGLLLMTALSRPQEASESVRSRCRLTNRMGPCLRCGAILDTTNPTTPTLRMGRIAGRAGCR